MPGPVIVVDYDSAWPLQFQALRHRLAQGLAGSATAIEHVGSTAVSGLAAKPIIDIDVVVPAGASLAAVCAALEPLGYSHRGDLGVPGREAFDRPPGLPVHHLYVCAADSAELRRHLRFRDRLRAHPEEAQAYGALKRALAQRFRDDRAAYTDAKAPFVAEILARAGEAPVSQPGRSPHGDGQRHGRGGAAMPRSASCGLIYYNFPGHNLEQFAAYAGAAGFTRAEIAVSEIWREKEEGDDPEARAAQVRALLQARGVGLSALSAGNDFLQPDDAGMARQVARLERVCRLARLAGTDTVRIDGGWTKDAVPQERWFDLIVAGLRASAPFLEREGFTLALDNHGLVTNDADFQKRIFDAVGSKRVGANVDTMNYRWAGHDLATVGRFYHVIAPYARHVHFKDGRGSRDTYRGAALGEGELDLALAVRELEAAGYSGVWTVEYEGPRADAEAGYSKGLAWLRAHVAQ